MCISNKDVLPNKTRENILPLNIDAIVRKCETISIGGVRIGKGRPKKTIRKYKDLNYF